MLKISCFVSYCHDDTDEESLDYLVAWLQQEAGDEYEIIVDRNLAPGARLDDFMGQVRNVDAIILLFSPEYKRRVLSKRGGVYGEFRQVMDRFQRQDAEMKV